MFPAPPYPTLGVPQIKQNVKSTESFKRKHNVQSRESISLSLSAAYTLKGHEIKCQVDNLQPSIIISHLFNLLRQSGSVFTCTPNLEIFHLFASDICWMIETVSPLFSSNVIFKFFHCMLKALFFFFPLKVGGGRENWAFQKAYSRQDSLFPSNSL